MRPPLSVSERSVMQECPDRRDGNMQYRTFGSTVVVRMEPGEELIATMRRVCEQEKIRFGTVTGIGAADYAKVGVYNVKEKKYHANELKGALEITNLCGNITTMDGALYLHIHITVADEQARAFGGHLNEANISATTEFFITRLEGEVDRFYDDGIGLNLLKL